MEQIVKEKIIERIIESLSNDSHNWTTNGFGLYFYKTSQFDIYSSPSYTHNDIGYHIAYYPKRNYLSFWINKLNNGNSYDINFNIFTIFNKKKYKMYKLVRAMYKDVNNRHNKILEENNTRILKRWTK